MDIKPSFFGSIESKSVHEATPLGNSFFGMDNAFVSSKTPNGSRRVSKNNAFGDSVPSSKLKTTFTSSFGESKSKSE